MKTIDINTTQNVTIEYEVAAWRERVLAFALDLFIISFVYGILVWLVTSIFSEEMVGYIAVLVSPAITFYTLYSEIALGGQTLGKRAMGIRVVKLNGSVPRLGDYAMRWAMRLLDIWLSIGSVGTLLITSSPKGQRLGCMLSGTTVVRLRPNRQFLLRDILNIQSLQNYSPQFPQVTRLSEADMLFVKNALERQRKFQNDAHRLALRELSQHLQQTLNIQTAPKDDMNFLRQLVNDYIVLTRS